MRNSSSSSPTDKVDILKIAVTGSAASGKSSVCRRLQELGLQVVSSDFLAREAVRPESPAFRKIVKHFGKQVLKSDGTLDRKRLRHIIVRDERNRGVLESFVHPRIIDLIHSHIAAAAKEGRAVIAVEVPLLFELSLDDEFDVVLLIVAERRMQVERLARRDRVSPAEAEALLKIQLPDKKKIANSDYIIHNTGPIEQMVKQVDEFFEKFCKKIQKNKESA